MAQSSGTSSASSGPGVGTLLGVAFVVLKLCGVIHWSWVWVLAPFWIGLAFALLVLLLVVLVAIVASK